MPATLSYGVICADRAYTVEQLTHIFQRSRDWVNHTFLRPVDGKTKQRLLDKDGAPLPGVYHFRKGNDVVIPGQCLLNYMMEHATRIEE